MTISYSNTSTQKPYNVLLVCFFLLLALNVNSEEGISFNYTNFTNDGSLTLQGDGKIWASGTLALPNDPSIGWTTSRALYSKPVPIWDPTTGNVASFVTSFSFVVADFESSQPGDGIVFFLAPYGSGIPPNSPGGALGIFDTNSGFNKFVALEFDSFVNIWDPNYKHIGINVDTITSLKSVRWNRVSGSLEKVTIIYDSPTNTLGVVVTHASGGITTIEQEIDLKAVLPKNVSIGFSATTAANAEKHKIYSWSFTSTFNTKSGSASAKEEIINIAS